MLVLQLRMNLFFHPPSRVKLSFNLIKLHYSWLLSLTHGFSSALSHVTQLRASETVTCATCFRNAVCSTNFCRGSLVTFCEDTNEAQKTFPCSLWHIVDTRGSAACLLPRLQFHYRQEAAIKMTKQKQPNHKGMGSRWRAATISSSAPNVSRKYQEKQRTFSHYSEIERKLWEEKKFWTSLRTQIIMEFKLLSIRQEGL